MIKQIRADNVDIFDEDDVYVCITHQSIAPCEQGDKHLISNWQADVVKILSVIASKEKHQKRN